jgi:hypothetical protein
LFLCSLRQSPTSSIVSISTKSSDFIPGFTISVKFPYTLYMVSRFRTITKSMLMVYSTMINTLQILSWHMPAIHHCTLSLTTSFVILINIFCNYWYQIFSWMIITYNKNSGFFSSPIVNTKALNLFTIFTSMNHQAFIHFNTWSIFFLFFRIHLLKNFYSQ